MGILVDVTGTGLEHPRIHLDTEVRRSYNGNMGRFWDSFSSEESRYKAINDEVARENSAYIVVFSEKFLRERTKDPVSVENAVNDAFLKIEMCEMDKWVYLFNQKNGFHPRTEGILDYVRTKSSQNRKGLEKHKGVWIFYHALALYRDELIRDIQKENHREFDECSDIFARERGREMYNNIFHSPQKENIGERLYRRAKTISELDTYFTRHPGSHVPEEEFENPNTPLRQELVPHLE